MMSVTVVLDSERTVDHVDLTSGGSPVRGLRVVVVGSDGDPGDLLRDPAIEVVRVRSLIEAVAQVASAPPVKGIGVVVALSGGVSLVPAAKDFIEAVGFVDRTVSVVHIGPCDPRLRDMIHGVVTNDMKPDELRAIVEARIGGENPMPAIEVFAGNAEPGAGVDAVGDLDLVERVLHGGDVLEGALALIRARLNVTELAFEGHQADEPGAIASAVHAEARRIGFLTARGGVTQAELNEHAAWLGAWLTLERQSRFQRLEALTDPLTGAWNRRYFDRYLSSSIESAKKSRLSVTVMVFDLDGFKKFNDQFGHAAGDEILRETVRLLRSVIRPSDRVCRIGGDEFAVIFYEPRGPRVPTSKPPDSISRIARRFQSQICGAAFPKLGADAPGTLTISGGLATYPWDGQDASSLLERADQLAIEGKRAGKNAIVFGPGALRECAQDDEG
jgi:diguanylate cyclase (GGDEF)-like protein